MVLADDQERVGRMEGAPGLFQQGNATKKTVAWTAIERRARRYSFWTNNGRKSYVFEAILTQWRGRNKCRWV
jgi:hypothetical protein